MQHTAWEYVFLLGGGFLAGIINTLAGNGSAITLPLLLSMGMDANAANATNRVGVLLQTFTAVASIKRTERSKILIKESVWYYIPTILGSIGGALLAIDIDPDILKLIIGLLMIFVLFTLLLQPKKWLIDTNPEKKKRTVIQWLIFFAIGFYGGFIQMGIGVLILSSLVLLVHYSLKDANIIKLLVALVMIVPAFIVFLVSGQIEWLPGIALAIGTSIGAWFAMRYLLEHPKASAFIRYLLIVVVVFAIGKILYPYLLAK
jgi:uncharacterized membrane protein YfcA